MAIIVVNFENMNIVYIASRTKGNQKEASDPGKGCDQQ